MIAKLWVLDKRAHVRIATGADLPDGVSPARLAICEMGVLEWLYSAQSTRDFDRQAAALEANFTILDAPDDIFVRVRKLQADLAHHRSMWHRRPIPDLFIAEVALHHGAGVLHDDADYELIAKVRPGLDLRKLT